MNLKISGQSAYFFSLGKLLNIKRPLGLSLFTAPAEELGGRFTRSFLDGSYKGRPGIEPSLLAECLEGVIGNIDIPLILLNQIINTVLIHQLIKIFSVLLVDKGGQLVGRNVDLF